MKLRVDTEAISADTSVVALVVVLARDPETPILHLYLHDVTGTVLPERLGRLLQFAL